MKKASKNRGKDLLKKKLFIAIQIRYRYPGITHHFIYTVRSAFQYGWNTDQGVTPMGFDFKLRILLGITFIQMIVYENHSTRL